MTQLNSLSADSAPDSTNIFHTVRSSADYKITASTLFSLCTSLDNMTVQPASTSTNPLIVKGAASQSADLLNINNSSNTILFAINSSGVVDTCNGITTIGNGIPTIVASGTQTGTLAAGTTICSFTPGADGTFRIGWFLVATSQSATNLNISCTYTDNTSTARTAYLAAYSLKITTNAVVTSLTNATPTWTGITETIRAKGSNAITVKTATASDWTFTIDAYIEQIA